MRRLVVTVAALSATAVAVVLAVDARRNRGTNGSPPSAPEPPAPASPSPPAALPAPRPTSRPRADQPRADLALPDGTFVPCLNGAVGAPPLSQHWGSRPWSPIVGVERTDAGIDWYVHADGTRTTTEMKWRPDLGRLDAMTRIGVPMGTPPPVSSGR